MAQHTPVMGLTAMVKAGVGEWRGRWCGGAGALSLERTLELV
jgi:hypothetical protein